MGDPALPAPESRPWPPTLATSAELQTEALEGATTIVCSSASCVRAADTEREQLSIQLLPGSYSRRSDFAGPWLISISCVDILLRIELAGASTAEPRFNSSVPVILKRELISLLISVDKVQRCIRKLTLSEEDLRPKVRRICPARTL